MMGRADKDLLAFVLRHGELAAAALREYAVRNHVAVAAAAAKDIEWLHRVNRRDWSHDVHTEDCMSDDAATFKFMTEATVEANHRLHMRHVARVEAALRAQR